MASKFTQQLNVAVTFGETQQLRRIPAAHLDPKFNVGIFFCFFGQQLKFRWKKNAKKVDPFLAGKKTVKHFFAEKTEIFDNSRNWRKK
jgi:hypothetical protein